MFLIIAGALIYSALRGPSKETTIVSVDDDPFLGPENAPVTIVEFSDFQCSKCADAVRGLKDIVNSEFAGQVKLVYRDFPVYEIHSYAWIAAEAAQSAFEQGRFWEYHDLLYERQSEWGNNSLTREKVKTLLKGYATELGLNIEKFSKSLEDGKYTEEVRKDLLDGLKYGVRGTPTFFVNDVGIVGFEESVIKEAINKALES